MHKEYLSTRDPHLRRILPTLEVVALEKKDKIYLRLCSSILSQQLNVRVARILFERFLNLYGGKEPTLNQILNTPESTLQDIGFSRSKSIYVKNVCRFFKENKLTDKKFYTMPDEAVIDLLTRIKGVGKWTSEMILIFSLAREDIFPVDDLGIRNTMIHLYNIREQNRKELSRKLIQISGNWAPYRSYASRYLWMWKDAGGL